jgi:GrpB-like predicted nucleotidyltransferase (UPF0157 family)
VHEHEVTEGLDLWPLAVNTLIRAAWGHGQYLIDCRCPVFSQLFPAVAKVSWLVGSQQDPDWMSAIEFCRDVLHDLNPVHHKIWDQAVDLGVFHHNAEQPAPHSGRTRGTLLQHHAQDHDDAEAFVTGYVPSSTLIRLENPDPLWPETFAEIAARIRTVLGSRVLELHHVGSTAVPELPAKPIIDIDLFVANPAKETDYVLGLIEGGFVHAIREPWWHEHRLFMLVEPRANVHVFGPDCPEVIRNVMFRDWLRSHPADRQIYAEAKQAAAVVTNIQGGSAMDYNRQKQNVVRDIYDRMFHAYDVL